jgi:hypothetical protein
MSLLNKRKREAELFSPLKRILNSGNRKVFHKSVISNTNMATVSRSPEAPSSTSLQGREDIRLAEETVSEGDVSCISRRYFLS